MNKKLAKKQYTEDGAPRGSRTAQLPPFGDRQNWNILELSKWYFRKILGIYSEL